MEISTATASPGLMPETARRHLDTIRVAVGADRTIASMLGVSPSQVSRWRGGQTPDPDNADRVVALALIVEILLRWLDATLVGGWLLGPNAHLADRTPAYLIRQGRLADVLGAAEALKAGVYA